MKVESKGKSVIYQGREISLGYGQINHLIPHDLWQCGLSLPALGLAGYLYTLPKQWKLSVTHLSKQLAMSKNTCRKYLKEIFTNPKAREVFKVKEAEINTYDFDEGFTAYDHASDKEELENFTSSVAKDVSLPNRKRVLLVQTQQQRYLLNLCFGKVDSSRSVRANSQAAGFCDDFGGFQAGGAGIYLGDNEQAHRAESTKSAQKPTPDKNAQNLSTIKRDSKESLKDSSLNRARKDFSEYLDLKRFSQSEQEAIKLWITYKQESSKTTLKPTQIDFQLRKITRFKEQGQDICEIIERSLNHSWQGLFPVIANTPTAPVIASFAKQSTSKLDSMDCHAHQAARNDRITPKMPKNIGAKALLCVK